MADLRTKLFGLAGALLCANMAFAVSPATCAAPSATTIIVRAEGTTEQVAQLTFVCTVQATAGIAPPSAAGINAQVFMSPALPVTSKVTSTTTGATEAQVVITCTTCVTAPTGTSTIFATVSGSTLNFSGTVPALTGGVAYSAGDVLTFVVSNVRVNATSLSVGSGVPPSISETVFVSGAAVVPAALAATTVGFAQNGLGTTKLYKGFTTVANALTAGPGTGFVFPNGIVGTTTGANNFVICNAYSPVVDAKVLTTAATAAGASLAAVVQVNENFVSAFKTAAGEASQVVTASNAVVDGTRIALNFANVPSNVTVYVPNGVITSATGYNAVLASATNNYNTAAQAAIQLTGSAAGTAFATVTGSSSTSIVSASKTGLTTANGLAPVTVSGGAGTAVFEVTNSDAVNLDTFNIPVFVVTTANTVPGSATAITVNASLNPVGSTVIPNFAVGSSTSTLTGSTFNLCTTSLLFPFVTNQLGFDTGIAISNTSTDPFGTLGATPQSGTCTLNFYGNGAPTPNNVTTANIPTGTVYSAPLSSVAAGFQGYIIAGCTFQFAHGFAFITNGVGANGGLSQGYLAAVIPDVNQIARAANGAAVIPGGAGESLGN